MNGGLSGCLKNKKIAPRWTYMVNSIRLLGLNQQVKSDTFVLKWMTK